MLPHPFKSEVKGSILMSMYVKLKKMHKEEIPKRKKRKRNIFFNCIDQSIVKAKEKRST